MANIIIKNIFEIMKDKSYSRIISRDASASGEVSKRLSFAVHIIDPKSWASKPHSHEDIEQIFFINKGVCTIIIDEKKISVKDGDIVYIPPGLSHSIYNDSEEKCKIFIIESKD